VHRGNPAQVEPGQTVFAHYTGKLQSGEVFDSTTGKPHRAKHGFYFTPGAGEVIQGWDVVRASLSLSLCAPCPSLSEAAGCQRLRARALL
jgi:hypothetical protein